MGVLQVTNYIFPINLSWLMNTSETVDHYCSTFFNKISTLRQNYIEKYTSVIMLLKNSVAEGDCLARDMQKEAST